jgi:hypothetical protein
VLPSVGFDHGLKQVTVALIQVIPKLGAQVGEQVLGCRFTWRQTQDPEP